MARLSLFEIMRIVDEGGEMATEEADYMWDEFHRRVYLGVLPSGGYQRRGRRDRRQAL